MRRLVLALLLVLAVSSFACAANVDSMLVDMMKSAKGLVPVIVEMNPGAKHADVKALGGTLKETWTIINGFSADLPVTAINALAQNPNVKVISYDKEIKANLNIACPAVNSNFLWNEGYDGDGVVVAILDTGIFPHNDLAGKIIAFKDFVNGLTSPYDDNGHGTHLAGIVAGGGSTYKGAAPHARLVGVKVLGGNGSSSISTIITGINWVVSNKSTYGIKIMLAAMTGTVTQSSNTDPLCVACRNAWNAGLVVILPAGNSGPGASTIGTPGNEPLVITVGTSDDKSTVSRSDDIVASFSSRGPTPVDGWAKPDVVAPGTNIISCDNATTGYVSMSGTSQAAALVAGICAQYLESYPYATPAIVKSNLKGSCISLGYTLYTQGSGIVDAYYTVH